MESVVTTFFGGAVGVRQLPLLRPPTTPDAPILKRLDLPQGELAQFYDSEDGLRYAAVIELVAGSVRGNHYHRIKREQVYVLRGSLELLLQELLTQRRAAVVVPTGGCVLIQPGIAHALRVLDPGFAIEFSEDRYAPDDTYRHLLL